MKKRLSQLLKTAEISEDVEVSGIKTNSKDIKKGDAFLCIKGVTVDRHDYIAEALERGAVALIVDRKVDFKVPIALVKNTNDVIDEVYANFYDHPEKKLKLIGVTGTDGKTSCATIIEHLIGEDKCAYIGTNGVRYNGKEAGTHNTTPAQDELYRLFDLFLKEGIEYVAMETSSEAFYRGRLKGLTFYRGAISNITSEHLNVHKTIENYVDSKMNLFRQTRDGLSILNRDDKYFKEALKASKNALTYGRSKDNDLFIKDYKIMPNKTKVSFVYENKEYNFISPLLGEFNVENLAESFLVCLSLGMKMEELLKRLKGVKIAGRMESIDLGQDFYCLVDYAHTPNGIHRFMEFVKSLDVKRIIAISGQAGGRDPYKRKDVGYEIASKADLVIFTSEDPRFEDVDHIIDDMVQRLEGYDNYIRIIDREEAIAYAIKIAEKKDLICILGKGAEDYMMIKDVRVPFSDVEVSKKYIQKRLSKGK